MTAAQKTARANFKKAIAYRKKTGVSLKDAFASVYGKKKVGAVKKKIGALPVGFKGNIFGVPFKIVNQYDIYNNVSAIMEDTDTGGIIVVFDGKGLASDKAKNIVSYVSNYLNIDEAAKKMINSRMLKFATNMQKEVKDFNAGKKKTIKKEPLKIPLPKNIVTTKKRLPSVIKLINKTIDKVYKKKVANKKLTNKDYDRRFQAKKPGKRTSASGNTYYESRSNRSDKGKLLGIGKYKSNNMKQYTGFRKDIFLDYKNIIELIDKYTGFIEDNKYRIKNHKEYPSHNIASMKIAIKREIEYLKDLKARKRELKKFL